MSRATVILASDAERKQAARWCMLLPINSRVEFKGVVRTVPQNARLWAMLTEVAIQVKWHGVKLTPDDWKVVFTAALKRELRIVPNIEGNGFVQLGASTSDMSKEEIGELMELISAFGAREGVVFHDPTDEHADHPTHSEPEPKASERAPDEGPKIAEEAKPKRAKKADKAVEAEPDQPQQQDSAEGGAERPAEIVETQAVEGDPGGGEVVAEVVSEAAPAEVAEAVVVEEPDPVTIPGRAPRGVRYVLSGPWGPSGKESYLNGATAGNAGRLAGLPEYEAHPEPIAQAPEKPVQAEVAPGATTQPETIERDALDDLSDAVPHMETWAEIKAAYLGIGRSDAWKTAKAFEQTAVKLTVYQAVIELVAAGKATVTPETDVTFFGIWLQYMIEKAPRPAAADEVQACLDKLVTSESFGVLSDAWKSALRAKTDSTIAMLRGA